MQCKGNILELRCNFNNLILNSPSNLNILKEKKMPTFVYRCMNTSCGFVEYVSYAPSATGKCPRPHCGGITQREQI